MRDAEGKANLLAKTFAAKCHLPLAGTNRYTEIDDVMVEWNADRSRTLTVEAVEKILSKLDENSATGPDLLPARILKHCENQLALPLFLLAMAILRSGEWPQTWGQHWVAAIYKKKSVSDPNNYRGVHMTAQLAKIVERVLRLAFSSALTSDMCIGQNQFAYREGRGSRDSLAYLVLTWLCGFREKARFGLCFRRVCSA